MPDGKVLPASGHQGGPHLSIAPALSSSGVLSILRAAGQAVHVTHCSRPSATEAFTTSVLRLYGRLCTERLDATVRRTVYLEVEREAELRFDIQRPGWQEQNVERGYDIVDQSSTDVNRRLLGLSYLGTPPFETRWFTTRVSVGAHYGRTAKTSLYSWLFSRAAIEYSTHFA